VIITPVVLPAGTMLLIC